MTVPTTQGRFVLAKRPQGSFKEGEHLVWEAAAPVPAVGSNQLLVRNLYMSLDPALRPQMSIRTYVDPVPVGSTMRASTVGEVVQGAGEFRVGDLVLTADFDVGGWQEYYVAKPGQVRPVFLPPGVPVNAALGILGLTGLTAYFGLLRCGAPVAGETVVVSGAAGATGSVVAQIAKHVLGCTVVGIAGGVEKCRFLTEDLGIDAAIDYKAEKDLNQALRKACPKGVDVYFDNVGGDQLNACLRRMRLNGRIVMCGAISGYDQLGKSSNDQPGIPSNVVASIVSSRLALRGFIVMDFVNEFPKALADLGSWLQQGKIKNAETVVHGLPNAAQAFRGLFDGTNKGKLTVKIAERSPSSKL
eukprot:TRINITY_DN14857_c0_g1_i1.p1 TRINITY_DN14857_c0_g1~~TRINITY_DN14857_c0_g1_i1.p1  ORF type:complete len:377 (+),score=56.82 TRINITY_DN14857_c0_g1_i1:60-1133(+)